ncbi:hypothetical protein AOZ06_05075 [Kibdelosporangium phytohabitans]|uniref:Cytochrome n=2 Tax=Kibdelosporangium phytohabitans TaxID=860235 RepID=A0A0N9HST6_9PSEU|nr:hypothetical protein AOZ06_05075 [Kibdelosporangium phytohabitans]
MAGPIPVLFSDEHYDRVIEVTDALLPLAPVRRCRIAGIFDIYLIVQYDHVRAALRDPRISKDAAGLNAILNQQLTDAGHPVGLSQMFAPNMLNSDGSIHTRLRRLVSSLFTHQQTEQLRPRIHQHAARLVDSMSTCRPVDLMSKFALPLPLTVICELLGIPQHDHDFVHAHTTALVQDDPAHAKSASDAMTDYFNGLIAAKQHSRRRPTGDLLSALIHTGDSQPLSHDELLGTLFLLFVAGHETTAGLIGNGIRWLLSDPTRWRSLATNPAGVPNAVEEVLRWDSPVRSATHRWTVEPVVYGGVSIPAGSVVLCFLHTANRDPARFDRASELDLQRDATGHVAFGHGPHYCLGAHLARLVAHVGFTELTQRFPAARLAIPEQQLRRQRSVIVNGHIEVPVLLGPRHQRTA